MAVFGPQNGQFGQTCVTLIKPFKILYTHQRNIRGNSLLLRRITEHVKDQNWFAVGLDFFIVVVGILIAFQITNWNETRNDRALEREYLALLAQDIKTIEETLGAQIAHEDAISDAAKHALVLINDRSQNQDALAVGHALMGIWGRMTLSIDSPTFTELKSAGRLTIISDTDIRSRLIAYFDKLPRTERIVEKNNEFFVEHYTGFLRDSGIGFIPAPSADCDTADYSEMCVYGGLLTDVVGGETTHSAEQVLSAPSDDPIWTQLRSQIAYRTLAAIANSRNASAALTETREISALIEGAD